MSASGGQHRAARPRRRARRWPHVLVGLACVLVGAVIGFLGYWKVYGTEPSAPDGPAASPTATVSAPQVPGT